MVNAVTADAAEIDARAVHHRPSGTRSTGDASGSCRAKRPRWGDDDGGRFPRGAFLQRAFRSIRARTGERMGFPEARIGYAPAQIWHVPLAT